MVSEWTIDKDDQENDDNEMIKEFIPHLDKSNKTKTRSPGSIITLWGQQQKTIISRN